MSSITRNNKGVKAVGGGGGADGGGAGGGKIQEGVGGSYVGGVADWPKREVHCLQKIDHQQHVNIGLRIAACRKEEPTTYGDKIQLLLCGADNVSPATSDDEDLILLTIFQSNTLKQEVKADIKCGRYIWLTGAKIFGHIEGRKTLSFGASNYGCRIKLSANMDDCPESEGAGVRERPPLFDRCAFEFGD
eukprot:GHVS01041461.1.p1 GENE.GHVS01041461.1~~GHVS01041461.1.p1  ORF type:complete len:190 (-),score=41.39 GHVS01041461.1:176-745(-)